MRSISLSCEIRPKTVSPLFTHWYGVSNRAVLHSSDHPLPDSGLSPVLLTRARLLATEHAKLSESLVESFDTKVAKRAGELAPVAKVLKEWENANESIVELLSLLEDVETDAELRALATEDLESSREALPTISDRLKKSLIPKHPFADLPCLLEIRPGAGGDEAGLFAYELLRMYMTFCSRRGLRPVILKQDVEDGPSEDRLSEAVIEIEAEGAYNLLRTESGVHRVQRVPATETKGRTHTSAVSVMVLPSFPESGSGMDNALNFEDPNSDYYIDPQEVRVEKMRAGGAGGQHVNKTESAIRLTHTPTGTVVSMQDERSQQANRRKAWQVLRAKIAEARQEAREQELVQLRRGVLGGVARMGRGDKIRTYNYGQSRCTDHRTGITIHNLDDVLEGGDGLETVMESVRNWMADREVEAMVADELAKQK
ncbi:Peptide chain release factor class I/class II [Penicillium maclennaniae]|uniref:Peptide chain release factor class I/class II n=1 Tax=Penicillium maclennaniae TaxID=1343394 RepID=UPI00254225F7|nr:Peptide chain release factor class I/class II [Penicillium maclennaniae]KAJ5667935.1 Peptide chain release factor class I/class II [Penicillium maclennaniae]